MADVRTSLIEYLGDREDGDARSALASAVGEVDLAAARLAAKDDPASAEAAAVVIARLVVDDAAEADLVDSAKALAQRAPRDASGNDVALVAGLAVWRVGGEPQAAEPLFRRVRRTDAANPILLDFYRELFGGETQGTQLMQVLVQARRGSSDADTRFGLAEEMAALAEERLGSADRAIEVWRSVLREDGHDPRAIDALERLYRDAGKWTALVELLKDEVDRIEATPDNVGERIEKLLEIVGLYRERLKLDTMALTTLQRILDIDPGHEASLEALAETYASAGRWNDLLGVYQRRIDAASSAGDTERQIDLLRKVATIWIDHLGNPQRALDPLSQVRELAPRDAEARALLGRIHEQRHDWRALIALRREALEELSADESLTLRIDLARTAEQRLGDRREAIAAWNDVLEHHGDVDYALDSLARLYEREARWAEAAEIAHRQLARTEEHDEAVRLLTHLGSIYSDRLRSRSEAARVWEELVRIVPGHDKATRMLRDTYVADGRWDDLTALYDGQDRIAALVDVLQSAADRIQEIDERVALYRRVATLCNDRLEQPERALKALERTLAIQPDNLAVAHELIPIYREQGNWARLLSTYEVLLRSVGTDDERLQLIASMKAIAQEKLASPTLTLQWAARAYELRPTDAALRDDVETAAEHSDGWDELTTLFESRVEAESVDDEERLVLLRKLAIVARDRLQKPDDAQRYFRRIVDLDPNDSDAMAALEDIYSSGRRWDDLSDVYRKRLDVTTDTDARIHTLRGLAKLQEEQLADLDGAVASHSAVLDLAPEDDVALLALCRIHRHRGSWESLATVLQRRLDLIEAGGLRVPVLFELAQIHADRLRDSQQALDEFLAVLEIDPGHVSTVSALESLRQADPTMSVPIMRGLLPYYRRAEERSKEAEAMEVLVAAEEDADARLSLLEQLAATYERLSGRHPDAMRIRQELFGVRPGDYGNRQSLRKLGRELNAVADVTSAYQRVLQGLAERAHQAEQEGHTLSREDATLRRDLRLELAGLFRDDLGRPEDAELEYRDVLEHEETHQGAYEALEALLQARHAHQALVGLYRRRVDAVFNQREQKHLLSRIVEISRNVLGDRETAIRTAEELLDLIPDDLTTVELLAQMYGEGTEAHDRESLEEILGRWAELVEDTAQRNELRCRRAALRMQYLGDAFGAVDLLGQVLADDPDHQGARDLLEELLEIHEVQLQACALLEPFYVRRGDHAGHIRVLHVRRAHAENVGSVDEAVTHLLEIARLEEQERHDAQTAFGAVREAYLMDPARVDTREEVERLGLALGKHGELVDVWRAALSSGKMQDLALRIDLHHRIAVLLDEHLRDSVAARTAYTDLLALDPPDAALAHKTVAALCRLHLEAGDGPALVEAQRALLRFTDDPAEQVKIKLDIATVQEQQLGERVGAAVAYGEVLDMQPDNVQALDALERLFLEEEEWERLCEVLEHRISVTNDPRGRASVWRQLGEIVRDQLADLQRAVEAFSSILDLKVGREDTVFALQSLVALNERLERWVDVEEGLRRLTSLADRDSERAELLLRTAEVTGRRLSRGDDALDQLKRVLDLVPTDGRARGMVSAYLEQEETRERATRILTPLYEAEQNWPALLSLEELQARHQPSGRRRLKALLKVAQTNEERLNDPARAFVVLCEAMAEAADQPELSEILDKVERLGADPERSEALATAYEATVEHILDSALQHRVLRNLGGTALNRLGQLDRARSAYERVLEVAPDDNEASEALEQIYLRQDDHAALAGLLVRSADRTQNHYERDSLLIRAAEIQRTQLDDAEEAIQLYERLSNDGLMREGIQEVLEPLYERTGRYRELAAHLNRNLAVLTGKELVETHLRLGRLYGEQLEDPEEGMRHLGAALRLDPDHAVGTDDLSRYLEDESLRGRAAEMLEPIFMAVQDWTRLVQIQEIRLDESPDPEERAKILLRIAQIEEDQLEDLERAFGSYARIFKEQPQNNYVRDQLGRLAGVTAQTQGYAELLTEYVMGEGAGDDSDAVLGIVREAADLWSGSLRTPKRAIELYERLITARPDDPTAFGALEHALRQAEMWTELETAYWREADTALDEDRQVEVLRKIASLAIEQLESREAAARAYARLIELRPEHEFARGQLEEIYAESERWHDLVDLLRDRLDRIEEPLRRAPVFLRIAEIQRGPLEEIDAALDTFEALFAESPGSPAAVTVLEQIAEAQKDHRPRIVEMLRPIYEQAGKIYRLVDLDEWQLAVTEDPAARHELYREMARLYEREPGGGEQAFRVLARALTEPGPEDALEGLDREIERLATDLRMPGALSDAFVSAAGSDAMSDEIDRRLQMIRRSAELQLEIGEPARAAEILRGALEVSEEDEAVLALLDQALVRLGHHDELRGVLSQRARIANDDRERVELLRRLGRLLEDTLVQAAEAEKVWRELLDVEPSDQEALQRLSKAYEASGDTSELVGVLERQIDTSTDDDERRNLRMQLAAIHREALKDRAAEIDVLRNLLAEAPTDDDALATLARALIAEELNADAADVIQERASLAAEDDRKAALLLEAARLYAGPIGDVPSALDRYESVLQLAPTQEGALSDLVGLVRDVDASERAARLAISKLDKAGRYQELADVQAARAELSQDPDEQCKALRALAVVRLERLDDRAGGLEALMRLMDLVEGAELVPVLDNAGRLAAIVGDLAGHVDALAARASDPDRDPEARVMIGTAAARMAEQDLGDSGRALAVLVPLLDSGIADVEVCTAMERLARAVGDVELVERVLREWGQMVDDPQVQGDTLVRLGDAQVELGRIEHALESYRDALDAVTGHGGAVVGLERLLERAGEGASTSLLDTLEGAYQASSNDVGLTNIVRVRLRQAGGSDAQLLEQLALLCERGGGEPAEAVEAWGYLLALDGEHAQALDRIVTVAREHGLLPRAGELMLAAVDRAREDGRAPLALALATAGVQLRDLRDGTRAMHAVEVVLEDQPEHPEGLELLVEAARATGDHQVLHDALARAAAPQPSPEAAVTLWRNAAEVAETALGNPALAVRDLEELLALDENDGPAWDKLLALRTAAGDYEQLAEGLGRRVMITNEPEQRREQRYRLANVLVDKLDRVDDAIAVYQDMIGDQPDDLAALAELEVLLRRLERWDDVREVLERKLEATQGDARIEALETIARLDIERLDDLGDAIERLRTIVMEQPGHERAESGLEDLLTKEERWEELADLLEQRMQRMQAGANTEGFRDTASRLAELLAERLGNTDHAQEILDRLLEVDPTYVPGILALASVYEARGDEGAMRLTLNRASDQEPQGAAGALLQLRLARLAEGTEARRTHLELALKLDPTNTAAASQLLELSEKEERWDQVAYLLELAAGRAAEADERRRLTLQRVDVLMQRLGNPEAALNILHSLYQQVQDDTDVNRRIADALFQSERYEEAAGMYNWLVQVGREDKRTGGLAHDLTRLARIEMVGADPGGAREHLLEAYRIDTTNVETMIALGDLHEVEQDWGEALKIYRTMLLQNAEKSGLLRRGDIYLRLADAHLRLDEKPKALAMLRRGVEEDREHPDLGSKLRELE